MKKDNTEDSPKKKKSRLSTVLIILILLIGLAIMAYPTFSDWWNSFHQSRAIASYTEAVEELDPKMMNAMLKAADDYNKRLLRKANRYSMSDEELEEYESLLDLTGSGVMGYIQIKSIGVNLPIYHGTDESILQIAIGHIQGTSLPVGGTSTHSALSGHRGLPSAKLFSDLDKMKEGDTFTITVLNRTLTYQVDQIEVVLPEEIEGLSITAGQDYCTLITCTPYGINTHRLLVRGKRIDNIAGEYVILPDAAEIPSFVVITVIVLPLIFVVLLLLLVYYRRRKPTMSRLEGENYLRVITDNTKAGIWKNRSSEK